MKKNYKLIAGFIVLLSLLTMKLGAQCISTSQYPSNTTNVDQTVGVTSQISTCQYSEYAVVTINASGAYEISDSQAGDWVTVANNATGSIIYGFGQCPYSLTLTPGTYYLHFSTSGPPNCTHASSGCRTTAVKSLGLPCTGTPVAPTIASAVGTVCPGGATTLTVNPIQSFGITYQWYSSPTVGGSYLAIPNATTTSLSQTNLSATNYYELVATCSSAGAGSSTTTPFAIVVGAPPVVQTTPSQTIICPNGGINISLPYNYSGVTYAYQTSTTNILGPYTAVTNATNAAYSAPNTTVTTYFQAVVSCTSNPTASVITTPTGVIVQGLVTNNAPYFESFEGITNTGQLPNCSWSQSNTNLSTYTVINSQNRSPRTGSKYASIYANPGSTFLWTNGVNLVPGITYSASLYYKTECNSYTTFTNISIMIGANQNATGAVVVASSNGPAASCNYKSLSGTFTVATAGLYYMGMKTTTQYQDYYYLSIDDIAIDIPCSLNSPTVTATAPTSVCLGSNVSITAAGANTYSWSTGSTANGISTIPVQTGVNTYSVVGTNTLSNCSATVVKNVNVLAGPFISAFTTDPDNSVCPGSTAVLYAVGSAASYTWSTFGVAGANTTVSPTSNTTYTVRGSNLTNCVTEQTIAISVKDAPNVSGTPAHATICSGDMAVLTGSGAESYTWSATNGAYLTGATVTPMPTSPTNYNVVGTGTNGCTGTAIVSQNVVICTGIQTIGANASNVNVYPNPTTGDFTIEANNGLTNTYEVTDLTGRVISSTSSSDASVKFNSSNLAAGVYYVKIKSAGKVGVVKIVKQ